jgi:hypothetical protein
MRNLSIFWLDAIGLHFAEYAFFSQNVPNTVLGKKKKGSVFSCPEKPSMGQE